MLCTPVIDHIWGRSKSKQPGGSNLVFATFAILMQNLEKKKSRADFHLFLVYPSFLGECIRQIPTVSLEISFVLESGCCSTLGTCMLCSWKILGRAGPEQSAACERQFTRVCASGSLNKITKYPCLEMAMFSVCVCVCCVWFCCLLFSTGKETLGWSTLFVQSR